MASNFVALVRKSRGPWEQGVRGETAREAKRALAKKAGLPVRVVDPLPIGRSKVSVGKWAEVLVLSKTKNLVRGEG